MTQPRSDVSQATRDGPKGLMNERRWSEIVGAAAAVFSEVGYRAATLQEIASRVGLLKGSLYYYIETKEDLLYAVIEAEYERGLTTLVEDDDLASADAPTRLAAFIRRWMRVLLATDQPQLSVLMSESRHLSAERRAAITARRVRIHTFVRGLVAQGVAQGAFVDDAPPGVVANALFALMDGSLQWYRPGRGESVDELALWHAQLFLRGLGAELPAGEPQVRSQNLPHV